MDRFPRAAADEPKSGRLLALAAIAAALLTACSGGAPEPYEQQIVAMGTWVSVAIVGETPSDAAAALREIEQMLRGFERDYYAWGDGELAELNLALQRGETFEASAELADLLRAAQRLSASSDGAFDPGVGPLVELWGFNDGSSDPGRGAPDAAAVARLATELARMDDITISDRRISSRSRVATLDLGGIAKGEAVDRILALLSARGITNAMVDAGGDLRVLGQPPGRFWRIGVRAPREPALIGVIELRSGEAAFTSGDYERFFEDEHGRAHHLIDPATGFPVAHTQAVTVIGTDGLTADAAATALFIAGPERWRAIARRLGIDHVLRVDASGRIEVTAPMRERLQISDEIVSDIIVVDP